MEDWSLVNLLAGLHDEIQGRLAIARKSIGHPVAKGDASEEVWLELLKTYLPYRYQVAKAFVVDSTGVFSEQIDVLVFDRQYTPFIFKYNGQTVVPAEGVYAAFEAKQTINAALVNYAHKKVSSVRRLYRTSLPIPHAGGEHPPKKPGHVLGGLLTFESEWNPPLGKALTDALSGAQSDEKLDLGCIAAHGSFGAAADDCYVLTPQGKPATAFLFELIARLQNLATVPMIDLRAYARWLAN
jgi:hypothetical protein